MIGSALTLVAAAAAPPGAASDLVPGGHKHEWVEVTNASGVPTYLDVAYRGTGDVEGTTYPVVLVRYLRGEPIEAAVIVDFRIAIDCQANAISGLEVNRTTAAREGTSIRLSLKETLSTPFTPVYAQNEARVAPLFKHACGPDWTMKAPE
ncbi:hypothetical protein FGU71_08265 [Erythrobacter insulae]|uniref:Uncharacterized protein n=1 Tax=Erythrobacter insulae TaxID=2584124 RepID=A0A547PCI7_9SPHN|nr:hypothetical protein [Erythrobacter insulae]TRD11849.1 hypothetical protein FGU71_08265 [Erythrobacter insulae]